MLFSNIINVRVHYNILSTKIAVKTELFRSFALHVSVIGRYESISIIVFNGAKPHAVGFFLPSVLTDGSLKLRLCRFLCGVYPPLKSNKAVLLRKGLKPTEEVALPPDSKTVS